MLDIKKIKFNELKAARYNPRQITPEMYEKLKQSIKSFGVVDPIIINLKNKTIIGGHQRYHVLYNIAKFNNQLDTELNLIELGDVGWVFPTKKLTIPDKNTEKALNIALNKINGEWNYEKLINVFEDLIDSDLDIELTGFSQDELNNFLSNELEFDEIDTEFGNFVSDEIDEDYLVDETEEVHDIFYLETGDEWKFGNNTFKIGEVDLDYRVTIYITGKEMKVKFTRVKGSLEEPIEEFKNSNQSCKGLERPEVKE